MFTKSNKSRRSVSGKHSDYRKLNSSSETSFRANEAKPVGTRENIVAALLAIPHKDIKYPILFGQSEPWEKFHEKVKECVKEKTFSFTLSYIWQEANMSLTKDSWGAFTHYINTQCSNHTVRLEMKCTTPSLKERIMFHGAAGQAKPTDLTVSDDSLTNGQNVINSIQAGVFWNHIDWGGTLCPPPFLLYLLSNYHQTWHANTLVQNLSKTVIAKPIVTSL